MEHLHQDPEPAAELEQLLRSVRNAGGQRDSRRESRRSSIEMLPIAQPLVLSHSAKDA